MNKKVKKTSGSILLKELHHNRWFIWAIVIIVVVMGGLAFYISIASENDSSMQAFVGLQPRPDYSNSYMGFSVNYPSSWVIDDSNQSSDIISFDNPINPSESVNITEAASSSIAKFKKSSIIKSQSTSERNGMEITVYTISTPEENQLSTVAVIQYANKAFYITGNSSSFNYFLNNFRAF